MKKKEFTLNSKYDAVTPFCKEVRQFCESEINETKICDEAEICLTEALNNIIKHAYRENPENKIDVKIWINNSTLVLELIDTGISRTNFEKPTLDFNPDVLDEVPESGMGLFIIDQLMDETDYKTSGDKNIFIMKKKLG